MKETGKMRELTEIIFRAMNTRDFDLFERHIADEVAFDFPGVGRVEGRRRTISLVKSILRKYPKLHFKVTEIITQGVRACAVWTNQGESVDGSAYSNSGMTLIHFEEGRISLISDYFKDTSFL